MFFFKGYNSISHNFFYLYYNYKIIENLNKYLKNLI